MKKTLWLSFLFALFFIACGDDSLTSANNSDNGKILYKFSSSSALYLSSVALPTSSAVRTVDPIEVTVDSMTDSRDGQIYKTVKIGEQTWMAQNLNYETENSYCYDDKNFNCVKYGRLYTWAAAMDSAGIWSANGKGCGNDFICSPTFPVRGACPEGWHLPSDTEWEKLFTAVGGRLIAGKALKSSSGWSSYLSGEPCNGSDALFFSALTAGSLDGDGAYIGEGYETFFWSSSQDVFCSTTKRESCYSNSARNAFLYIDDGVYLLPFEKKGGISIRCLKD
jgi:uncharacterized protein (TIGR02145 family)